MNHGSEKTPVNDEAIEAMAASWLVQKDEGFTPEQAAEFARWCAAHPKHAAAVAMLEETCELLEKMPAVCAELKPGTATAPVRRESEASEGRRSPGRATPSTPFPVARVFRYAAALAACFVVAFAVWQLRPAREVFGQLYATSAGGYQRIVLPDESVIELNASTELRVRFFEQSREVTLTRGEAHFSVAKNPARPFVVGAGRLAVRAVGTAFNVRVSQADVEVLVTEGRVQVSRNSIADAVASSGHEVSANAALLEARQRMRVAAGATDALPAQVKSADPSAALALLGWRNPLLKFDATPLSDVVRQFNEHNRVQLEIGDAELRTRGVAGAFYAHNVEVFISLLEQSGDIAVERPDANRIVLRRAGGRR